jgi:hypothetical protein
MNITGNIIAGQVTGETAKQLSERFGKIIQDHTSMSINRTDTSISHAKQLDTAISASKIAALSSGEFVGMVADEPGQKIELKAFHAAILNDHEALKREQDGYKAIPIVRDVTPTMIQRNYLQIRQEVEDLVSAEMERIMGDPGMEGAVLKKG